MKLTTGVKTKLKGREIKVFSQILEDEPIYNDVTVDTALNNVLKEQLIKLHK